ncbi:MAG: class I SAM-dependent methyltransferase [Pseudomonadota bacterium]
MAHGDWWREDLKCVRCHSSSRQRAMVVFLQQNFPDLSNLSVYEPASVEPVQRWLKKHSRHYMSSHYFSDVPFGRRVNGLRNESLESLTFPNARFDLIITQDVFEHIERPKLAFREVARVLRPGGSHVFTIPYYPDQLTEIRVQMIDGEPVSTFELEYHDNPVDEKGSLVFTRFGADLIEIIKRVSGLTTTIHAMHDKRFGIEGESILVFHSTGS